MKKRFLLITTVFCIIFTTFLGCSGKQEQSTRTGEMESTENERAKMETADAKAAKTETGMKMVVDTDKKKVAVKIPDGLYNEKNMKTDDLESEDSILYYSRFTTYRPDVNYSSAAVSEMLFDIYVTDVSAELAADDMNEAKYLDTMTVSIALQNSDIERKDNETHGQAEYRVLTYTGTANDGTTYTVYTRMTVLDGCFIMFRAIEYNGSNLYVSYDDMSDIFDEVYDSVIVQNVVF